MNPPNNFSTPEPIPLARNAFIASLVVALAAAGVIAYEIYQALLSGEWQLYVMAGLTIALFGTAVLSAWLNRHGKPALGMGVLFLAAAVVFLAHSILATNLGLALSIATLGIAITGSPVVLPHRYYPRILFVGVLVSFLVLIVDRLQFSFSVSTFEPLDVTILAAVGSVVLLNLIFLATQFRIHPLRNKLILTVTVIAAASVVVIASISLNASRVLAEQTANQLLQISAEQVASTYESFLNSSLAGVANEARYPIFGAFLSAPAEQRMPVEEQAQQQLTILENKNSFINTTGSTQESSLLSYRLLDAEGRVVMDTTRANIGENWSDRPFFQEAIRTNQPYRSPLEFSENDQPFLYFSAPVSQEGTPVGVLVARYNAGLLQHMIGQDSELYELAGPDSYAFLLDENLLTLAFAGDMETKPELEAGLKSLSASPAFSFTGMEGNTYRAAAVRMEAYPWWVIYAQPETVLLDTLNSLLGNIQLVALLITGAAALVAILLTSLLTAPVSRLTGFMEQVIAGDLSARATAESNDEIGNLAMAFNQMTERLQVMFTDLEERVADRTLELQRRSDFLEASAEVSQASSSILDPDSLMRRSVELIQERFKLYYVGLFTLNDSQEHAELRAGTGEAGRQMLQRKHRLLTGESSMVGWCIQNNQARIALQAGEDPVRLATAELPDTRSEAALPLRSRGRVLGALTVQSDQENAFDEDMIAILQIMADQLAIALDNARLYAANRQALEATRQAYGEVSREAWRQLLMQQPNLGFLSDISGVYPADGVWLPEMEAAILQGKTIHGRRAGNGKESGSAGEPEERSPLAIPIKVRGNTVGVLDTYKPGKNAVWSAEEIALIETITEQLSVALDSARLYSETQLQAERERMVSEITSHMRETLDIETVLRTAAEEIYQALGLQDVVIRLEQTGQAEAAKERH